MKNKVLYTDIKLGHKVYSPNRKEIGEVTVINNMASLAGIQEPIFKVKFKEYPGGCEYFGLKYIIKMTAP